MISITMIPGSRWWPGSPPMCSHIVMCSCQVRVFERALGVVSLSCSSRERPDLLPSMLLREQYIASEASYGGRVCTGRRRRWASISVTECRRRLQKNYDWILYEVLYSLHVYSRSICIDLCSLKGQSWFSIVLAPVLGFINIVTGVKKSLMQCITMMDDVPTSMHVCAYRVERSHWA